MQARMSSVRIESILTSVKRVREGRLLTVKQLLGLMSAASNVIPFGLLYMRPLQWWLKTKGLFPRGNPLRMIKFTRRCLRALEMWRKPLVLVSGPVAVSSLSPCNASDECISHRLGSDHKWPPCPRSVEWSPSHVAHQLLGDAGCVSSTQTLSTRPERLPCIGASIHPVEAGAEARGMDASPWGGESDMESFEPGSGGSVCDSSDITLSPLVISDSSSSAGAGCYGTGLESAPGWGPSIAITPFWPGRVWFLDLISLLDGSPWGHNS